VVNTVAGKVKIRIPNTLLRLRTQANFPRAGKMRPLGRLKPGQPRRSKHGIHAVSGAFPNCAGTVPVTAVHRLKPRSAGKRSAGARCGHRDVQGANATFNLMSSGIGGGQKDGHV